MRKFKKIPTAIFEKALLVKYGGRAVQPVYNKDAASCMAFFFRVTFNVRIALVLH